MTKKRIFLNALTEFDIYDAKQDLKIEYLKKDVEYLKNVVKELEIENAKLKGK